MKKILAAAVGVLACTSGLVATSALPASAAAGTDQCIRNTSYANTSVAIQCGRQTSGANRFRAIIKCSNGGTYYGPYRPTDGTTYSAVGCAGNATITATGIGFTTV